ncbi:DUF3311 domain-containing protein [Paractinoplanes lichenicola]|uniref:DUF3311 domain-containing protein n=1 Tax=Paractinoplanes lichenicola TaxID=2802976 RepID=UPI0027DBCB36|nr:DUF3311 domain-containing protein [Actinoplanes lichenicola]
MPIVLPLMPVIYNRVDPTLLGMPFFYWCQLGFAFLASGVIAFVHKKVTAARKQGGKTVATAGERVG